VVRSPLLVALAVALVGLVLGAGLGRHRFVAMQAANEPVCVSCHHAAPKEKLDLAKSPHGSPADVKCHACHVIPLKEYLLMSASVWGLEAPRWVDTLEDPTIDQQSCMECHLGRGRGSLSCERCHEDGQREVDLTTRCETCHVDHPPIAPHQDQACRDCHVEALLPANRHHMEATMHETVSTFQDLREPR
jgi:hypothetical protein